MLCRPLRLFLIALSLGSLPSQALDPSIPNAESFLNDDTLRQRKDPATNAMTDNRALGYEECRPRGPIETTLCDFETLESVNDQLFTNLHKLVDMPFFRYFMVDLYRDCPFWNDDGQCTEPGCAITSVDESEIPEKWRAAALSNLEGVKVEDTKQLHGCSYRDSDFCLLDHNGEGEYYDLALVPERYTGYSGIEANRVWGAIYRENCFGLSEGMFRGLSEDTSSDNGFCLEKRVYYKVISGLHASISTHICAEHLNQSTGQWAPNLGCFLSRLSPSKFPERLPNMYFTAVLLLRAVSRLSPYLQTYDYCSSGTHEEDQTTLSVLQNVLDIAKQAGRFDEGIMFQGLEAESLKEEFKGHFRNVTRIMDCVGCDKCRLWGKVQTTGLATALKILFEMDEDMLNPQRNIDFLQRSELVALFNTLHRFSESLHAISVFRGMMIDAAGDDPSSSNQSKFTKMLRRIQAWFIACRESTVFCIRSLLSWCKSTVHMMKGLLDRKKQHRPGFSEL